MNFLQNIPNWNDANHWIDECLTELKQIHRSDKFYLSKLPLLASSKYLNLYQNLTWQRFVLATFLADVVSYPKDLQVNFERLAFVMHVFSQGFQICWTSINNKFLPVGYSAFFPISNTTLSLIKSYNLSYKLVLPDASNNHNIYMFNCSVIPQLKQSFVSSRLIFSMIKDIDKLQPKTISTITISDDGQKLASALGMIQYSPNIFIK